MIIKGASRAAPAQLARHLQRSDTNEKVHILELQSPALDLGEAFRDWQTLVEGTRGFKGLYHANIDPAADYTMTTEQWQRAVEVLEKELGLEGQPRAVVMHQKHGREHVHVVWARTDIDAMVLRSDSQNYQAHERASQKLEMEFGHEPVPGKHAKRDREKQPEFPRAEANHAEWQQGERTGLRPGAMKEEITALKQAADNAQAFKAALEEHGYILARGDRRDFVIIDPAGQVHSLGRQLEGMKAAELRAFMKPVDPQSLPTVEQAKEVQKQRPKLDDAPAAEPPKTPEPPSDPVEAERERIRSAVTARHEEETLRLVESQKAESTKLREALDTDSRDRLDRLDKSHKQQAEAQRLRLQQEQAPAGILETVQDFFSPARAAEREADLKRKQEQLAERQKQERADYAALLQQTGKLEIGNLTERQALALHDHVTKGEEDLGRYLREREAARQLQAELKQQERRRDEDRSWDGPEMKAANAEVLPTAERAAAEQAKKTPPEQQHSLEEKKLLSPDKIPAAQKDVVDRQPHDAADGPQRQQDEFERTRERRAERMRFKPRDRIIAMKQRSANAEAFKTALASEGCILARGARGDLMVVDRTGAVYGLARQIPGMSAAEFQEFMKGIDHGRLPSVKQAGLMHQQYWKDKRQEERAERADAAARERQSKAADFRPSPKREMEALRKAITDRQGRDAADMADRHKDEYQTSRKMLDDDIAKRLGHIDAAQEKERRRFATENAPPETLERVTDMINRWRNPERAQERDADLERRRQQMEDRLKKERVEREGTLTNARDLNLGNLAERQAQQLRDLATKGEQELERYARERETARQLRAEIEERERQRKQKRTRDGPERPPPRAR